MLKMQLRVNEQMIQQEFNVNQKSVTCTDKPESKDETYAFKYKYYNKDGKKIGD